jgi:hypothetical protein
MTAYDSARFDDLLERVGNGEKLTPVEQARFDRLTKAPMEEEENRPRSFQYGGDMLDVF